MRSVPAMTDTLARAAEAARVAGAADATMLFREPRIVAVTPGNSDAGPATVVVATLAVDPQDPLFAGHYPGFPIYPGVCLIELVYRSVLAASALSGTDLVLTAVRSMRFQSPVLPGEEITARIESTDAGGRLHVKAVIAVGERRVAAVRLECTFDGAASSPDGLGPEATGDGDAGAHAAADLAQGNHGDSPQSTLDGVRRDVSGYEEITRRLPHRHPMLL